MRVFGLLAGVALAVCAAAAQEPPDVAEILKRVSEAYQAASQYELRASETMRLPGTDKSAVAETYVAFKAPDRYRLEGKIPGLFDENPDLDQAVMVYDGSGLWFYFPKPNLYTFVSADDLAADPEIGAHTPQATDDVVVKKYRVAANFVDAAKLLRDEEIDFGDAKVACYVVSVPEKWPGPYTWWVEKSSYHVLREIKSGGTVQYKTVRLGEPLPDSLFRFVPPPGAKKLELDAQ